MKVPIPQSIRLPLYLIAWWLALVSLSWAQSETLRWVTPRSCFFGGGSAVMAFAAVEPADPLARVAWALRSKDRVLSRGTSRAKLLKEDGPNRYEVSIPLPAVREGVVLRVEVEVRLPDGSSLRHPLWLYPRNAFPQHDRWWDANPLRLFDPAGSTSALLKSQEVPHRRVRGLAELEENGTDVLLIGQGLSLNEHPKLVESLTRVARRGGRVLCLAPNEGDWPIDSGENESDPVPDLILRNAGALNRYDKRFDPLAVATPLGLATRRGRVVLRCGEGRWAWLERRYGKDHQGSSGRLLVCGLDLTEPWEDDPVPRHLLAGILKHLATDATNRELE